MNVNLGETLDQFVADLVKSGRYQSQSEVLRDGLRLLKDREDLRQLRLAELRKELRAGLEQIERGETTEYDPEEIKREGRRLLEAKRKGK
jgi:antitoxin ParD1/3/4